MSLCVFLLLLYFNKDSAQPLDSSNSFLTAATLTDHTLLIELIEASNTNELLYSILSTRVSNSSGIIKHHDQGDRGNALLHSRDSE